MNTEIMERDRQKKKKKVLKENTCQPRVLYQIKITFRNEGEIQTFSDEGHLVEFTASRSALKEMLKEDHQIEGKWN